MQPPPRHDLRKQALQKQALQQQQQQADHALGQVLEDSDGLTLEDESDRPSTSASAAQDALPTWQQYWGDCVKVELPGR